MSLFDIPSPFEDLASPVENCHHGRLEPECPFCHPTVPEAESSAELGIKRAAEASADEVAGGTIQAVLDELIEAYLKSHPIMFVDDFWQWAGEQEAAIAIGLEPSRAHGAATRRAMLAGKMETITVTAPDGRPALLARPSVRSNLGVKILHKSLIFEGSE